LAPATRSPQWNRSIVALLVCVFCSAAAALVGTTALGKQVYDLTHQDIHLGLLGLAEFAPSAFLVLVTGAVADRFERTRISAFSAVVEAVGAIGLALYTASHGRSVVPIFGLVLVFGVGRAFLAPANRALPADIVSAERLPWLTSRRAVAWQSAIIIGPVVGGFLYAANPMFPYVAMAALLVVAAAAMFFVRVEHPARDTPPMTVVDVTSAAAVEPAMGHGTETPTPRAGLREAFEGLRFIRRTPILLAAISLDLFAVLFGGAIALLPAIATDRLGVGAVGLGWLRAAGGIGAASVTLLIARRPFTNRVGRVLLIAVSVFGVGTIALGLTRSFVIAFAAMAVLSGADAISVFIRSTLVPLATPFDKRGRVLAVESVFIGASNELGAFESGVAGQLIGTSGAVVLGGAATLVVAGAYAAAFPVLRRMDRFPQPPTTWTRDEPATETTPGVLDGDA
jgi:MFS family permease